MEERQDIIGQESNGLELDLSVLEKADKTYTSHTDANGIPLFTEKFERQVRQKKSSANGQSEVLRNTLFVSAFSEKTNDKLLNQLFTGKGAVVVKKREETGGSSVEVPLVAILAGAVIFLLFVWEYCNVRRRRLAKKKEIMEREWEMEKRSGGE